VHLLQQLDKVSSYECSWYAKMHEHGVTDNGGNINISFLSTIIPTPFRRQFHALCTLMINTSVSEPPNLKEQQRQSLLDCAENQSMS